MDNNEFVCEIAEIKYLIKYKHKGVDLFFKDYIIEDDENDNAIIISSTEEQFRWMEENHNYHNDAFIEYMCIMQNIIKKLPKNMLVMHGAVIEYKGKAYLFTAPSGTGKTTHIARWKKLLNEKIDIINGDKPELLVREDEIIVYGAPWCGKEGWQKNTKAPLAGICLLQRADDNSIEEINPASYIEYFLKELYVGYSENALLEVVDIFSKMCELVPFYLLKCNVSDEAVKCSFEMMTKEKWINTEVPNED